MTGAKEQNGHRVLLVDDDRDLLAMTSQCLECKGFEVVAAGNVPEALKCIATENFDVLITDLHMPDPGDGLTVVSAMRHSQPKTLTIIVSGYPDTQSATAAMLSEVDEIVAKPFEFGRFAELIRERVVSRRSATRVDKECVGAVLQRCASSIIEEWLARAKQSGELTQVPLGDEERMGHLPKLLEDLILRLSRPRATVMDSDALFSAAAVAHGKLRHQQGYTPAMLVHESRILQVTVFGVLQSNRNSLDFSLVLPDVMTIADEVDAQLTQSMESYMKHMQKSTAA